MGHDQRQGAWQVRRRLALHLPQGTPERLAARQHGLEQIAVPLEFAHFGDAFFELDGRSLSLELYWLEGYGGGLFLPFADTTSGARPAAEGATCSTRSRAPISGCRTDDSSWTSTSHTTRPAHTTPRGYARSHRHGIGFPSPFAPGNGWRRRAGIDHARARAFTRLAAHAIERVPRAPARRRSHRPRTRSTDAAAPRLCRRRPAFPASARTTPPLRFPRPGR